VTTDSNWLPPEQHYARLPKTITSASLLISDPDGNVLLVRPAYHAIADTVWEVVGGGVNEGEYPQDAATREGKEELGGGITITAGRLLVVDCVPPEPPRPALSIFVFDGGVLTLEQAEAISLPENELAEWRFATVTEANGMLVDRLARRVAAAVRARDEGMTLLLHHGHPQIS